MDRDLVARLANRTILVYEGDRVVGRLLCDRRGICRLLPVTDLQPDGVGTKASAYAEDCDLGWC